MSPQEQHVTDEYQRRLDAAAATYNAAKREAEAWALEAYKAVREGREIPNCQCMTAKADALRSLGAIPVAWRIVGLEGEGLYASESEAKDEASDLNREVAVARYAFRHHTPAAWFTVDAKDVASEAAGLGANPDADPSDACAQMPDWWAPDEQIAALTILGAEPIKNFTEEQLARLRAKGKLVTADLTTGEEVFALRHNADADDGQH